MTEHRDGQAESLEDRAARVRARTDAALHRASDSLLEAQWRRESGYEPPAPWRTPDREPEKPLAPAKPVRAAMTDADMRQMVDRKAASERAEIVRGVGQALGMERRHMREHVEAAIRDAVAPLQREIQQLRKALRQSRRSGRRQEREDSNDDL
jgi:hypothetical protein